MSKQVYAKGERLALKEEVDAALLLKQDVLTAGDNIDITNNVISSNYSNATTETAGLMSSDDKTKLNGIASGAEVNVQANWNESDTTSDSYIQNKPDIPVYYVKGVVGNSFNFQGDYSELAKCVEAFNANKPFTVSAKIQRSGANYYESWFLGDFRLDSGTRYKMTLYNAFRHSGGYILLHYLVFSFVYSGGVASNASIGEYSSINIPDSIVDINHAQTITGKKTFTTLPESSITPTTADQFTNKAYVDSKLSAVVKRSVVQELPSSDIDENTIYMVPNDDPQTGDVYDEWIYVNNNWEHIGSTATDLTDYYNKNEVDGLVEGITTQYNTMPTASQDNEGQIVQYTGTTDNNYTNGYFYVCVSDGQDPATYSWDNINVQADNELPIIDLTPLGNVLTGNHQRWTPTYPQCLQDFKTLCQNAYNSGKTLIFAIIKYKVTNQNYNILSKISITSDDFFCNGLEFIPYDTVNNQVNRIPCVYMLYNTYAEIYKNGYQTFLATGNTAVYTPSGDYNPATKKYVDDSIAGIDLSSKQDIMQYTTMPTVSVETVGKIVQYIGTTDANYTNGYFYIGTTDGGDPATYSWSNLNVQSGGTTIPLFVHDLSSATYKPNFLSSTTKTDNIKNDYKVIADEIVDIVENHNIKEALVLISWGDGYGNTDYDRYNILFEIDSLGIYNNKIQNIVLKGINPIFNGGYGKFPVIELQANSAGYFVSAVTFRNDYSHILKANNTYSYSVTYDYNPAHKKYVDDTISNAIAAIETTKRLIVQTLPTQDIATDTIYMVPKSTPGTQNVYDEYMYINNSWEKIGDTEIDLSNYIAKDNTTAYTPTGDYEPSTKKYVDDAVANIDVSGKEDKTNKTTTVTSSSTDTQYASAKAVYDYVEGRLGDIDTILTEILNGSVNGEGMSF